MIRLLVSVADSAEARHAVDGGADLIDAKDPSTGALGAVSLGTLREIQAVVASQRMVTAALGDADDEAIIERAAFDYGAVGVGFVKVGFAGISSPARVGRLIAAAVRGVQATRLERCGVVAVAYADTGGATSVEPTALVDIAARAGATGVLLDTARKDGPGLLRLASTATLESWATRAHGAGLTVALAGKLKAEDLPFICETGADIVGVRGAACENSRSSRVTEVKVRRLTESLQRLARLRLRPTSM
jgi:(5-formylfuran-3-yl)methyl phosphate synthase